MKADRMVPNNLIRIEGDDQRFGERDTFIMYFITRDLSKVSPDISQRLISTYQRWEASGKRLAELGWTVPMNFTMSQAVALSDPANSDEDIERCIVDFYLCDQHKQLRCLFNDLIASEVLIQWHPLIRQCFEAFELNLHLVTIPSLLSVLEGAIAQKCNTFRTKNVHITTPTKEKASQENQRSPYSIEYFIWSDLATFIGKLYELSDFSKGRPPLLNRHWILHGRDSTQWTVADAIRLFNALHSVV
jgi:hypothetical protein